MKKIIPFLFLILSCSFAQTVVPISDLRVNNSSGVPVNAGQTFTVSGIVTVGNHFGPQGPGAIQDFTAGISVYGSQFAGGVNLGDSVTITGQLTHFNGLTQIDFNLGGAALTVHGPGSNVEPQLLTITQIINQEWNGFEEYESKLIRINDVTISGSGNFTGGTSGQNYPISDPTGSLQLRIDESVNIVGTPIPSGTVDIIGVLSQYKFGAPYNSGYQIIPRFIQDIVDDGRPMILNPVVASNITKNSFTVYFNTARNGNSQVKYGLTPALEMDSVIVPGEVTYHVVPVPGLQPSITYYFRAYSANTAGNSESSLKTVTTASDDTSIGKINIYFNFSVDTTAATPGNAAKGNVNFPQKLIDRINNASHSIDLALYSFFGMQEIADAIILARNRGVKVRVVYDNRTTQNSMQSLINAGIPVQKRFPASLNGIMHNKFLIFDARDTLNHNDWLWTGSWNVTSTEVNWENNVVEINDPSIARAYLTEFEEMWGSDGDQPNQAAAKFGINKTDNTPHFFNVGGKDVRVYFSPSDGTNSKILSTIQGADKSIYFATYAFTRNDLAQGIFSRFSAGVTDIKGVIDQINTTGSQYSYLNTFVDLWPNVSPTLHHKYAVIDASYPAYSPVVITGSHNWSNAAENDNDENTIFIYDADIANQYLQEFKKRYNESGGIGVFFVPVELTSFTAVQAKDGIQLNWTTATELNNFGFEIERSIDGINFYMTAFIKGSGTTTETRNYTYTDKPAVSSRTTYYYRLRQVDYDGKSEYSPVVEVVYDRPENYELSQNYPNPFNPSTRIAFQIAALTHVQLKVYDMTGQEIALLVNEVKEPGSYNILFDASQFASGIYMYRLTAGDYSAVRKMSIIK
jgi:phosphatidylserine/phosphatidylglycerophosphate/cardiolipin synthase-like enzyme